MKKAMALVLSLCFLFASGWIWFNEAAVTDWVEQRQIVVESDQPSNLIGLQTTERWLVVVVDFPNHPSTDAWGPDEAMNLLNQAALPYIEQLSQGQTTLVVDVHQNVVRASQDLVAYGADDGTKDTRSDGTFLPALLAEEVVNGIQGEVEWDRYDLNDDGAVDRFLILHTTKGQEENPGINQRIWSHFTHFENTLTVDDGHTIDHYTMASLQTGSSGVGTMLHEMLHQMGAADLYPVHDEGSFQSWKGPGDWDIMASGNWNGGGRWPALPTGATLDLIGGPQVQNLELSWPPSAATPCMGPVVELPGLADGGQVIKIQIGVDEYVYIEHRSDTGFDERLPGHGVLVTYQDRSVGNLEQNELNVNPNLPWLRVIEADGGDDLLRGINQGEASDVFTNNTSFGGTGITIRTHDGVRVPWTAKVILNNNTATVHFTAEQCTPPFVLDLPNHGATVLPEQGVHVTLEPPSSTCTSSLVSSDGRQIAIDTESNPPVLRFQGEGTANSLINIAGTVSCNGGFIDVDYQVAIMNRIPTITSYESTIDPYASTTLEVPIPSVGDGVQRLSVTYDGPLSRVVEGPSTINLNDESLFITIDPRGLLTENMLVFGDIVLSTEEGMSWSIPIELQATSSDGFLGQTMLGVHQILALLVGLLGAYTALPLLARVGEEHPNQSTTPSIPEVEQDAWGRPLDMDVSDSAFDVEK